MYHLTHIEFRLDHTLALMELELNEKHKIPYEDYRGKLESWQIIRNVNLHYAKTVAKKLGFPEASPRYYILKPFTILPMHTDHGTKCSINFILGDKNPSPITILNKDYFYLSALLDTTVNHGVTNGDKERKMLKLSLMDVTYEDARNRLLRDGFII